MSTTATQATDAAPDAKRPQREKPSKRDVMFVFIGLMVTMLMSSLSRAVLSTAVPTIVSDLGGVDRMT